MSIDTDFPATAKLTYLNAANVALMPRSASDTVEAWQRDIAENGSLNFDEVAEDLVFDEVRGAFARFIGATSTDVAVASSASEFVSSIAWAVMPKAGTRIVTTDIVFPSTSYPWARVARHTGAEMHYVASTDDVVDEDQLIAAIDDRTSVVSISHVEYSTGQRFDLKRISDAAARVGAFFLVDASQSLGAVPLDVSEVAIDALVTTSYKWLCGPFGVGLAYISPRRQQTLDPGITGWRFHSEIYNLQAQRCVYHNDARRFEFSTMAYGCAAALAKSIDYLQEIGVSNIMRRNLALADQLVKGISDLDIHLATPLAPEARSSIVSGKFRHIESKSVVRKLVEKQIFVSPRRDYFRVSPHLYNTPRDIDRLVEELAVIGKAGPRV
ncbi:aminotransferase class V-fold PLP-dependent enzyme [Mesorhizobium sp. 1M-11]|uniref:aminotransferase class V-fold PLP-dependent enzyme n=1 Tax=Mesorhizobium sp. 1M-11 TaxID=1529006 RepID=UPI0006C75A71|nr:aminotransferase class V-fold PLP-dependent enzyme [Mesorhizobium sp. 1M-11]